MNADIDLIKTILDAELRLELLVKSLNTNFLTEPTILYFFSKDEVEELQKKGILIKVEGYLFNKRWLV
jgi:hypothetical protein